MTETYIRHPNVVLGKGAEVGPYVTLGVPPKGVAPGELETRIGRGAIFRSHTVIYAGNQIGNAFQTGHGALVRESNRMGDNVSIGSHTVVEHHVEIGDRVRIHSNAFIPEFSVLEEDCWVGPNAVFTNARYPQSEGVKDQLQGPHLEPHAKIGANSTLLPGTRIGRNALVGAGSVVVRDVPADKVVVGNPARVIGTISEVEAYELLNPASASHAKENQ